MDPAGCTSRSEPAIQRKAGFARCPLRLFDFSPLATSLLSPSLAPSRCHLRFIFSSHPRAASRRGPLPSLADPMRGGGAPGPVTGISVALARRDHRVPLRPGRRLSALRVAIFGRGTGASSPGSAHRNPRRDFAHARTLASSRSGPAPPATAVRSAAPGRHDPAPPRNVSGDAPHERGYAMSSISSLRSQYRSQL